MASWLAECHLELSGLVLINPLVEPPAVELFEALRDMLASGVEVAPGIGSDIAIPGVTELAYDATPLRAGLSLFEAAGTVGDALGDIRCPVLLLTSREDHVVPASNGARVMASVAGPVERIWLERSYHVATLDYDSDELEARTVAFASMVLAGAEG